MATHNEVAHAWANQTGKHRKGFNMFYEGMTIFSYGHHFPIARLVDSPEGRVVLMTTEKYSVSTAKHITYTWRACHHMQMFHVPLNATQSEGYHEYNVQSYLQRITESLEKAKRARKYGPMHIREAEQMIDEVQDYIRIFEVSGFDHMVWEPDAIVEGVVEVIRLQREREAEARRRSEERARKDYRENRWPHIKTWLKGGTPDTYRRIHTPRPLPRIKDSVVETSWGASVPLAAAIRLYQRAVQCRRGRVEYIPNTHLRVGDFHLRTIKPNGDIVVGCHDIPFWFMHYAARRAGIPAQPAH